MPTRNVNLTDRHNSFIESQVESGYYNNGSEVVRAALTAMEKQESERLARLVRLKAEVQKGINSADAGKLRDISTDKKLEEVLSECEKKALARPINSKEQVA